MMTRCSQVNCFAHAGEACWDGARDHTRCPFWSAGETSSEAVPESAPASVRVPWSGGALGLTDLVNLSAQGRMILIGVLGAQDTGKTTLLLGNYLELLRGGRLADASFAASRTLHAWESLAAWVRFDDAARRPSFPPHTPRGTSRVPGLLHVGLRGRQDELRDVLLTDAPGEWFTRWAIQEDAPDAEGARWIVERADAFLVLADCERLAGSQRGPARNNIRQLLERLGNHARDRPTTLVWSKADHPPNAGIRAQIRRALNECIPHASEVESTTTDRRTLVGALESVLSLAWSPPRARAVTEPVLEHHPFAAFRGHHAHS